MWPHVFEAIFEEVPSIQAPYILEWLSQIFLQNVVQKKMEFGAEESDIIFIYIYYYIFIRVYIGKPSTFLWKRGNS